eukprot:gene7332-biopygen21036
MSCFQTIPASCYGSCPSLVQWLLRCTAASDASTRCRRALTARAHGGRKLATESHCTHSRGGTVHQGKCLCFVSVLSAAPGRGCATTKGELWKYAMSTLTARHAPYVRAREHAWMHSRRKRALIRPLRGLARPPVRVRARGLRACVRVPARACAWHVHAAQSGFWAGRGAL